jgi:hypothetical protein
MRNGSTSKPCEAFLVGKTKKAFIADALRKSSFGMGGTWSAIFCSALMSCSGAPVRRAAPRSATNSR